MRVLSKNTNKQVTHVIHIADTHVRTGDRITARVDEYKHVFQNFVEEIREMESVKNNEALLVIAGDLFHHKGRLETEGAIMMYEWLNQLLTILPVLVICGNHDFRQEDPEYKDMIEMMVAPYAKNAHKFPIHYLRDTGLYVWENIGFGVTSVKDTLQAYNTAGILTDLPKYPNPNECDKEIECRVALFHGSISQSALPSGNQVSEYAHGYPLEWFAGYDIAMFGDNHTQQINTGLNGTLVWGYPGSLVQQDGGESFLGHGYILWDIKQKMGDLHHVKNDYGTLNLIRTKTDEIMVRLKPYQTVSLEKAMKMKEFPLCPQIRVIGTQGDDTIVEHRLKEAKVRASRIYLTKCISKPMTIMGSGEKQGGEGDHEGEGENQEEEDVMKQQMEQLVDLNKPDIWKNFIIQNAPDLAEEVIDWLYHPNSLLFKKDEIPESLHDKITNKNKVIQQTIENYEQKIHGIHPQKYNIILQHMYWDYLMCYGENNWFDFAQMEGKVALLNGKNATGKSSFIDVMCLAIFGEPTMMRSDIHGSKMSVKVIHDKKPTDSKHDSAYVKLLCYVNDELFQIKRSFTVKQKDEYLQSKVNKIATVHKIVDNVLVLVADGTTMVNQWVAERFGSLPEILMSTILCQMDTSNFFLQKEEDQIHIIEKALHMETIHEYECILQEAVKGYKYILNELTTYLRGISDSTKTDGLSREEVEQAMLTLTTLKEQQKQHEIKKTEFSKESDELLLKMKGEVDTYGYDLEEAHAGLEQEQNVVDQYTDLTPEVLKQAHKTKTKLEEQEKALLEAPRLGTKEHEIEVEGGESEKGMEEIGRLLIKFTKMIENHEKKKPDEPELTEMYIQSKDDEYHKWLRTIDYMEINLDELNHTISRLMNQQQKLYQEQSDLQKQSQIIEITRPQAKHAEWLKEWAEWEAFVAGVSEMTVEEMDQRTTEIKDYLQKIEEVRVEHRKLCEKIETLKEEEASYNNVAFNPDCEACKQNPMRKRLDLIIQQWKALEVKANKTKKKLKSMMENEEEYKTELEELKSSRADRMKYELRIDPMKKEKNEWDTSAKWWKQKEEYNEKNRGLQVDLKAIFHELQGLQKIKTEYDVWIRENDRMKKEKEVIKVWSAWKEQYEMLMKKKQLYENTIAWNKLQQQKQENADLFQRIELYEHAVAERDEWMNILLSIQWLSKKKELETEQTRWDLLNIEIMVLGNNMQGSLEKMELIELCENALKKIQDKYKLLQQFVNVFVGEKGSSQNTGFKAWVYQTEIIPMIEREVNQFISPLDEIRLKIRYVNGTLLYHLEDRGNTPTLDYASGYQRFLIGIAMRIALARIGAVGQNVRHLIIDEGFVACDSTNILKVDIILKNMMEIGNYKSVLLMSHLDMIRDIAQVQVHITRSEDNVFSKITWGSVYPTFDKYKKAELEAVVASSGTTKKPRSSLKKIK